MDFLSDSRRAAFENRIVDDSSALLSNPEAPRRNSQKKMFYAKILIGIVVLIALATLIGLLYNKTSNLSQQIVDLQAQTSSLQQQASSLQEQVTVLQNSATQNFTRNLTELEHSLANTQSEVQTLNQSLIILGEDTTTNMTQLENSLSNTQSEVQTLNQSLITLGEDATTNMTQLENSLSNTQSGVQLLNQSLTTLEISVNTSIPTFLISYNSSDVPISFVCPSSFVSVPGFEFSISSQNGGHGICDFITYYRSAADSISSSLALDGSPIASIDSLQIATFGPGPMSFVISWSQNFEFSAGNHSIAVMTNLTSCPMNPPPVFYLSVPKLICSLYGVENNN